MAYPVGKPIAFEGYASDYDKAVSAIEFSLDQGDTWTRYDAEGATPDRWVRWHFDYTPTRPGRYLLKVRGVNEDGHASQIPAIVEFEVC